MGYTCLMLANLPKSFLSYLSFMCLMRRDFDPSRALIHTYPYTGHIRYSLFHAFILVTGYLYIDVFKTQQAELQQWLWVTELCLAGCPHIFLFVHVRGGLNSRGLKEMWNTRVLWNVPYAGTALCLSWLHTTENGECLNFCGCWGWHPSVTIDFTWYGLVLAY